jgi:hypothetical protein
MRCLKVTQATLSGSIPCRLLTRWEVSQVTDFKRFAGFS